MSIVPRFIIVDDVDPSIQYTGSWFSTQGTLGLGNASDGPPYENTLHGANSSASLSFAFNGGHHFFRGSSCYLVDWDSRNSD